MSFVTGAITWSVLAVLSLVIHTDPAVSVGCLICSQVWVVGLATTLAATP